MRRNLVIALAISILFATTGCSQTTGNEEIKNETLQESVVIVPNVDIKGAWTVISTPETQSLANTDWTDVTTMYDSTMRGGISTIFMKDSTFEIFENGICSCNGIALKYEFVDENAINFIATNGGLIFKATRDGDTLNLKLNEKYEVVLTKSNE